MIYQGNGEYYEWWNFVLIAGYFGYFLIGPRNHRVEKVETKFDL